MGAERTTQSGPQAKRPNHIGQCDLAVLRTRRILRVLRAVPSQVDMLYYLQALYLQSRDVQPSNWPSNSDGQRPRGVPACTASPAAATLTYYHCKPLGGIYAWWAASTLGRFSDRGRSGCICPQSETLGSKCSVQVRTEFGRSSDMKPRFRTARVSPSGASSSSAASHYWRRATRPRRPLLHTNPAFIAAAATAAQQPREVRAGLSGGAGGAAALARVPGAAAAAAAAANRAARGAGREH